LKKLNIIEKGSDEIWDLFNQLVVIAKTKKLLQ
jgi:hypothetical protein